MLGRKSKELIGFECFYGIQGMMFKVKIHDTKTVYGVDRVLIGPVVGDGRTWVNLDRLFPALKEADGVGR